MVPSEQAKQTDTSKPANERIAEHIGQTGNPYRMQCGKTAVELQFAQQDAPTLEDLLLNYFIRKKAQHFSG